MGIHKTLLASILAGMGSAGPLTFGVTLSSVVGGLPTSGSGIVTINQVAAAGVIVPVITAHRSTGVAPLAITFDALQTTAPVLTALPFSDIHYEWTFGDERGTFWSYGANAGGNNKNKAFGPVAAHVFETPGTFTVTLVASYINNAGQLSQTTTTLPNIVVTNPDTVFAGTATICISQNSLPVAGVGGAPAGCAVQQVANWSDIGALTETYKRVLLKRGDTWDINGSLGLDRIARNGPGIIGAYGTGAKPIVSCNIESAPIILNGNVGDWRIVDLDITSNNLVYKTFTDGISTSNAPDLLILRTDIKLLRNLISTGGNNGVTIQDCVIGPNTALGRGICMYLEDTDRLALLGNLVTGSNDHGCRVQGSARFVLSNNTVTSNTGYDPGHVLTVRGKVDTADYPTWNGLWSENGVVSDNYIDGTTAAYTALRIHPQNNVSAERIRNVITERNHVYSHTVAASFSVATGLTVRNNLFVTRAGSGWQIHGETTIPGAPFPTQGFFYNNTVYKPDIGLGNGFQVATFVGTVSGQVMTNNLAYAPLDTTPIFTNGATPAQYTGTNNSTDTQMKNTRPWLAASPVAAVDFTPSGSYAVDGGTFVPVYKNYFGTTVSGTREIGAI